MEKATQPIFCPHCGQKFQLFFEDTYTEPAVEREREEPDGRGKWDRTKKKEKRARPSREWGSLINDILKFLRKDSEQYLTAQALTVLTKRELSSVSSKLNKLVQEGKLFRRKNDTGRWEYGIAPALPGELTKANGSYKDNAQNFRVRHKVSNRQAILAVLNKNPEKFLRLEEVCQVAHRDPKSVSALLSVMWKDGSILRRKREGSKFNEYGAKQ